MKKTSLFVSYSQIAFFNGGLLSPFNDWTPRHVAQGFSWRSESVSFKTLVESGNVDVEFVNEGGFTPARGALRIISVPFFCRESASPEIASITESREVDLEPGDHQLIFETGWRGERNWCRMTAILNGDLTPRLLLADPALNPNFPLVMSAEPAE
jgi:hypothetical protein